MTQREFVLKMEPGAENKAATVEYVIAHTHIEIFFLSRLKCVVSRLKCVVESLMQVQNSVRNAGIRKWFSLHQLKSQWRRSTHS